MELLATRTRGAALPSPARRLIGAMRHELTRVMGRARLYVAVAAMAAAGSAMIVSGRGELIAGSQGVLAKTGPMLFLGTLDQASLLLFFWPLIVGGTLAEDVSGGLIGPLLTRAGSWGTWLGAKVASAYLAAFASMMALGGIWAAVAALSAPWDTAGLGSVLPFAGALAERNPLLFGLVCCGVLALAATTVTAVSMLVGSFGAAPLTSQAVTVVVYLGALFLLPGPLNPGDRSAFLTTFAAWNTPAATIGYWWAVLVSLVVALRVVIVAREV